MSLPFSQFSFVLYPRCYKVTDLVKPEEDRDWGMTDEDSGQIVKPRAVPLKLSKQLHFEVWLIDDGEYMTILVGQQTGSEFLEEVFGVSTAT